MREDNGDISGIMVVANEVTKQVEAKHFLEERERQFRNLVMQSPMALSILRGPDLIIDIVNYRMLNELCRRSFEEVSGRPLLEVFPELKGQKYPELLLEVLSSFAYISSHDLQEPLHKIQTFASRILETEPELTSINRQYFTRIQSAAGRMQALIKDLLAYSRTNETDGYEMRDLNVMLREIRTEIRENAENEEEIQLDTLHVIRIITFQIHQLFSNIFSNSV